MVTERIKEAPHFPRRGRAGREASRAAVLWRARLAAGRTPMPLLTEPPEPAPSDATARVRSALAEGRPADVTGLPGAARGRLVQQLLAPGPARARSVLAVATDEETADHLARDLAFFLGDAAVLRLPADAVLPYDDLSPDRNVEMERLAAFSRLYFAFGEVWAVVVSARGLARRVVPVYGRGILAKAGARRVAASWPGLP